MESVITSRTLSRAGAGALAAWLALAGTPAPAQVTPGPPPVAGPEPGLPDDLAIGPDDEVVVREYVIRRRPAPVRIERDYTLRPGSVVPGYVELAPFDDPRDPRLRRLAYFISPDDKIVIVDPVTRTVRRILER